MPDHLSYSPVRGYTYRRIYAMRKLHCFRVGKDRPQHNRRAERLNLSADQDPLACRCKYITLQRHSSLGCGPPAASTRGAKTLTLG